MHEQGHCGLGGDDGRYVNFHPPAIIIVSDLLCEATGPRGTAAEFRAKRPTQSLCLLDTPWRCVETYCLEADLLDGRLHTLHHA